MWIIGSFDLGFDAHKDKKTRNSVSHTEKRGKSTSNGRLAARWCGSTDKENQVGCGGGGGTARRVHASAPTDFLRQPRTHTPPLLHSMAFRAIQNAPKRKRAFYPCRKGWSVNAALGSDGGWWRLV